MANGVNQKRIDMAKMDRMWWKRNGELMLAGMEISRKPFGAFDLHFKMNPTNGKTDVTIVNKNFQALNASLSYEGYNEAINGVAKYFDEIDERVKNVPKNVVLPAEKERARVISLAIGTKMGFERWKIENGRN